MPPPRNPYGQTTQQFPSSQSLDPEAASQFDNAEGLRRHLLSHFASPECVDVKLLLTENFNGAQQVFEGHSIVLGRSPTLLAALKRESTYSVDSSGVVNVQLEGRYVRLEPLFAALRYIYGGPLLQLDQRRPDSSAGERMPSNSDRMENALQYIATGRWLQMPVLAGRGVEVAVNLLHWDTIPAALTFALDGGLSNVWNPDDGSEDAFSAASSDDSLGRPDISRTPTYDPFATQLLHRILDFTVWMFPPNFYLDASAPQLEECPRLPTVPLGHESRNSRSDPRLSQIRFGEIPIDRPSFATTTISSMLLSMPFKLLKYVLEHGVFATRLGPETASSIMRSITNEREIRRVKAQKAYVAGQISQNIDPLLAQNLYWEELVEASPVHKVGFRLARRKRDIDTPSSSGAPSERNK